jgi:hypothetical protein
MGLLRMGDLSLRLDKIKRLICLREAGFQCQHLYQDGSRCPTKAGLQVHHLSYARAGDEPLSDLIVLCDFHHRKKHGLID